jgi:hypothetical protein
MPDSTSELLSAITGRLVVTDFLLYGDARLGESPSDFGERTGDMGARDGELGVAGDDPRSLSREGSSSCDMGALALHAFR